MASNVTSSSPVSEPLEGDDKPEGPVAAAIIAGGVGAASLGLLTTLAEASTRVKDFLNLYDPVGPLAGKTIYAVAIWVVSWVALHLAYRGRPFETRKALTVALLLIALGALGTFPIFFQAFASE